MPVKTIRKKTVMKRFITMLMVLATVFANAVEKPKLEVFPLSAERAAITLVNNNPVIVEVTLKSEAGTVVYYSRTKRPTADYRKIFDFSDIADGKYELEFRTGGTLVKRTIDIENEMIRVGESEMRYDPYIRVDDDVLKLSYLNFDQEELKVYLLRNNNVVFETSLGNDFNVARGFDLSKLVRGDYQLVVSAGGNDYYYSVKK